MEIKSTKPQLQQSEIGRALKIPSSTLQQYKREIIMLSPYKIPPSSNTNTRKQKLQTIRSMTSK